MTTKCIILTAFVFFLCIDGAWTELIYHGFTCDKKDGCTCGDDNLSSRAFCAKDEICIFSGVAWCAKIRIDFFHICAQEPCICGTPDHIADNKHQICYNSQYCMLNPIRGAKVPVCVNAIVQGQICQDKIKGCLCYQEGRIDEWNYLDMNERCNANSPFEDEDYFPVLASKEVCQFAQGCYCDATQIFMVDRSKLLKCKQFEKCDFVGGKEICKAPKTAGQFDEKGFVCAAPSIVFPKEQFVVCKGLHYCGSTFSGPVCKEIIDHLPDLSLVTEPYGKFSVGGIELPGKNGGETEAEIVSAFCMEKETVAIQNNQLYCKAAQELMLISEGEICPNRNVGCTCLVKDSQKKCKGGQKCTNQKNEAVCVREFDYFTCEGDDSWKCDNSIECQGTKTACRRNESGNSGKIVDLSSIPKDKKPKVMGRKEVIEITREIMRKRGYRLPWAPKNRSRNLWQFWPRTIV